MKPFLTLSLLAATLTLSACATPKASAPPTPIPATEVRSDACKAFAPILFSRLKDTEETIAAVKAHNAAYDALCPRAPTEAVR